jgi:hypothetical protein
MYGAVDLFSAVRPSRNVSHDVMTGPVPVIHAGHPCFKTHCPHPEEVAEATVSKEHSVLSRSSFETQTASAPQDEV